MKRIKNDFYPTPDRLIRAYLDRCKPLSLLDSATILEPCIGDGAIANPLRGLGYSVDGSDIAQGNEFDATRAEYWQDKSPDWTISNPPFNVAVPIITHAIEHSKTGVIMLLRSSFLEPCANRRHLLNNRLTDICFVNPRPRFRSDTKNTDSATVAFFTWSAVESERVNVEYLTNWNVI